MLIMKHLECSALDTGARLLDNEILGVYQCCMLKTGVKTWWQWKWMEYLERTVLTTGHRCSRLWGSQLRGERWSVPGSKRENAIEKRWSPTVVTSTGYVTKVQHSTRPPLDIPTISEECYIWLLTYQGACLRDGMGGPFQYTVQITCFYIHTQTPLKGIPLLPTFVGFAWFCEGFTAVGPAGYPTENGHAKPTTRKGSVCEKPILLIIRFGPSDS